jgi:UPF0271 protein
MSGAARRGSAGRLDGRVLDLNADLGESFGVYRYGADEALMPLLTSANVACGAHAGDPRTMRESVALAQQHGVAVGAHVGLADRAGFGRRMIPVTPVEVHDLCLAQMGALSGFLRAAGLPLAHLKLHGALYMMANADPGLAEATTAAVTAFDPDLAVFALPGSALGAAAAAAGLRVVEEYFADRPYRGAEVRMFGWTTADVGSPDDAAGRAVELLSDPVFGTVGTVCVHSDTPGAPAVLAAVRDRLLAAGCGLAAPHATAPLPRPAPAHRP